MCACKTFIIAQIVHYRAQRVVPKWSPCKRPVLACGSGRRDRAATGFWVRANGRSASSSFPQPGRQAPVVLSALAPSVADGLPQRLRFVGPQCVAPVLGCTPTIFRAEQHGRLSRSGSFQRPTRRSPCRAWRTMASVKSSGCCWRTRCEGITLPTPGGMTRPDPVR
jgi:hypothetical protein